MQRLKIFTSFSLLSCALAWSAPILAAETPETFETVNVSRRTGGQVIYYQLDTSSAADVELSFSAKSGEVHIGSIRAISDNDETIPFQQAQVIRDVPKDDKGRYILRQGGAPLRIAFTGGPVISVISFRAEGFINGATVSMQARSYDSEPVEPPQPPLPPSGEAQCQNRLIEINTQMFQCNRDTQNTTSEINRTENNVESLQATLEAQSQPVKQCMAFLDQKRQDSAVLVAQVQSLEAEALTLRPRLEQYRRMFEEARATEYECYVAGRHEGFRARGATRIQALAATLNLCGKNNCGKNNWKTNFDCRPVR